ncbi:MAG: hypothetical protein R6U84_04880 [Candidatus Cloacimonadales bacterium]
MGTGQMLLVMLAVILFSTILISMYSNIDGQARVIERTVTMLQGQKIADRFFQKIETELIGEVRTFAQINSDYSSFTTTVTVHGNTFNVTCERAEYCDQNGNTPVTDTDFQLIEFSMWTINSYQDSVVVGTPADPLQKVFADMEL